ncbi:Ig-like domain-containing protein, partial [Capnocytophaga cynodegmi]
MRKVFNYMDMRGLYFLILVYSFFGFQVGYGQGVIIPPGGITVESGQEITQRPNPYELGKLRVQVNFIGSASDATVTVTLPEGVTMKPNSLVKESTGNGTITGISETGSIINFTITGASGEFIFSLQKLLSPLAHKKATTNDSTQSYTLADKVKIVKGVNTVEKISSTYTYKYPLMSVAEISANNNAIFGENMGTFKLLNGGNGKIFDIYFVVEYPTNIEHSEISYQGIVLNHIGQIGGKYIFLLPSAEHNNGNGLSNGQSVIINHKYNVKKACLNEQLVYTVNWGESQNEQDWYEYKDNIAQRTVSSATGAPNIEIIRKNVNNTNAQSNNTDYTKTYFKPNPKSGGCYALNETVGTLRYAFKNYGPNTNAASAIYKLVMYFREGRNDGTTAFFRPENFYIVNPDTGVKTPFTLTPATATGITGANKLYKADFSNLATDPDGTGKGLEDLDGDGKYNELPSQNELIIEYDLVVNRADNYTNCVSPNFGGTLIYDQYRAYATYETSCGDKVGEQGANPLQGAVEMQNNAYANYLRVLPSSELPIQLVEGGGVKQARFMFSSDAFYILRRIQSGGDAHNWRIQYNINLPAGVKATNVKWVDSVVFPPAPGTLSTDPLAGSVTTGQNLVVISPYTNKRGYVIMDLEADCSSGSGTLNITYEALMTEDIVNAPDCKRRLLCETKPIQVACASNCGNDGPSLLSTTGERAENSYGWTDHTMQTRHTKATMPTEMLKRALYLDDVEISASGKQNGQANNLYYSFTTNPGVSLNPKEIKFTFTSGTRSGTTVTLPATVATVQRFKDTESNAWRDRYVKVVWNLTSALNNVPLENDDTFKVIATYQVDRNSERLDNAQDILAVKESYFFMYDTDGVTERYCGVKQTPSFFVANTAIQFDGLNGYLLNACVPTNIGTNMIHLARRFSAGGTRFVGEFRPDRLIKTFSFTLPKTYSVSQIVYEYATNTGLSTRPTINIPVSDFTQTTIGNDIVYTLQNTYDPVSKTYKLPPGLITLHNEYVAVIRVTVQASCGAKTDKTEYAKTNTTHYDYFYHYGLNTPYGVPHSGSPQQTEGTNRPLDYRNKPSVKLEVVGNSTFDVVHTEQELKVKLTNKNGNFIAPYTWISIPDVVGIDVIGLYEGTNLISKQASITGESMYHISTAGLSPGQSKDYTIRVRLTNCSTATLKVYSGWNCNSFPLSYNQTCSSATDSNLSDSETSFTLNHSGSEVQLKRLITPNPEIPDPSSPGTERAKLRMCEDNWYEYEINSGKPGDVIHPQISITKEYGIEIPEIQVFYPFNSTVTKTLVSIDNNTTVVYDLLEANQVLYGTASGQDENNRKIRVRINVKPSCDFRIGSTFGIEVLGKNTCGGNLDGTRDNAITASVEGVNTLNYSITNTLSYKLGDANSCMRGAIYEGRHQISATSGNSSGPNGKVVLRIPEGFDIVAGTFTVTHLSGVFNGTVDINSGKVVASGAKEYQITIPANMSNGDYFTYEITIKQPDNSPSTNCGVVKEIEYYTIDEINTVSCPMNGISTPCPSMSFITAEAKKEPIKAERASLVISNLSTISTVQNGKEKVKLTFDIQNVGTVDYVGELKISLFDDSNNNGVIDQTDAPLGIFTVANRTYTAGATIGGLEGTIELMQEQICRLRAKILSTENRCLCDMSDVKVPSPTAISGLVENIIVCELETKQFEYNPDAPQNYVSYNWTSSDSDAMNYLSGVTTKNPTFTYTGTKITVARTYSYTLTIRRANGCEASQEVTVTVNPAPSAPAVLAQTFCSNTLPTISNLEPKGSNYRWYDVPTGGTPLSGTQVLNTGTYYVADVVGGCEGIRAEVTVTLITCNVIDAVDDDFGTIPMGSTTTQTVINNDTLNGNPVVIGTNVGEVTLTSGTMPIGITLDPTNGRVSIGNNVPSGIYTFTYEICENGVTTANCDTATVTVVVSTIEANDDDMSSSPVDGATGNSNLVNVLTNDTLNGIPNIPISDVTITVTTQATPIGGSSNVPVLDPATGNVSVPAGTPEGTYTITYQVCTKSTICDTANVVVVVTAQPINAKDDTFAPVVGVTGAKAGNVLSDNGSGTDTLGSVAATTANVDISVVTSASQINGNPNVPTLDTNTGEVNIPANTPAGTYTIVYRICEKLNPTNCDTATATVVVSLTDLEAVPDDFSGTPIRGTDGGNTSSVLTNDKLNGTPLNPSDVTLTWGATPPNGFTPNIDGTITIAPNT